MTRGGTLGRISDTLTVTRVWEGIINKTGVYSFKNIPVTSWQASKYRKGDYVLNMNKFLVKCRNFDGIFCHFYTSTAERVSAIIIGLYIVTFFSIKENEAAALRPILLNNFWSNLPTSKLSILDARECFKVFISSLLTWVFKRFCCRRGEKVVLWFFTNAIGMLHFLHSINFLREKC